jgi:hypothetical protein
MVAGRRTKVSTVGGPDGRQGSSLPVFIHSGAQPCKDLRRPYHPETTVLSYVVGMRGNSMTDSPESEKKFVKAAAAR